MKKLFETTSCRVEVKTGKAVPSRLQRSTGAEVARERIYVNSAVAVGAGVAGGVAVAEVAKWLLKNYVRLTCDACRTEATLDHHFCPRCGEPLPRRTEFWIGVGLAGLGVVILILGLLMLRLDLRLMAVAGGLLGAGIDLIVDSLWASFAQPGPDAGSASA